MPLGLSGIGFCQCGSWTFLGRKSSSIQRRRRVTPHEYWSKRGELGEALRHVRWERRAIHDIFRDTQDMVLYTRGQTWVRQIISRDIDLCKEIMALDVRYRL